MSEVRGVTFDFWDTLVGVDPGRGIRDAQIAAFAAILEEDGQARPGHALAEAFDANWDAFEVAWARNTGQYTPGDATDFIVGRLGVHLHPVLRDALVATFARTGELAALHPSPGSHECLEKLAAAGLKLGIVCDVGLILSPVLRKRLHDFDLLRFFDGWSFSDETDVFKPRPEAYRVALDEMGVAPEQAAHIGDNPATDVAGARALGMRAYRYAGIMDRGDGDVTPDAVVDDLRDLPALLGL
ncbi:MAG TPA: HAD family hydrolase [Actinomycetota bacterium]